MTEDEEILQAFLQEGRENLERLELDLVALEAAPRDPDLLARIYRAIHTIKGTCGFLGLHHLETLTHRGEDVLDALRAGRLSFDPAIATSLLAFVDDVRVRLETIERTGEDPAPLDPELLAALRAHARAEPVPDVPRAHARAEPVPDVPRAHARAEPVPDAPRATSRAPLVPDLAGSLHETTIRVDAALLDTLMDLAGELVLVRGRLAELTAAESGGELVDTYRHLRRATGELLENVRQARLQPIGTVMRKFPRIARDLAATLDKQVAVVLHGEEVGVDRAINEALGDALLHIVRNAVDHGLESAAQRAVAGKSPTGQITISASQEGGRVRVEVADDGGGIDAERVVARALGTGLIAREDVAQLDDAGRLQLIFLPGLSTRASVSSVSGRGIGMDAVRAHLARVGGTVEVSSAHGGPGTTFRIDVPLTLAIVSCVVVRSAGRRYCVPQAGVREVVALHGGEVTRIGGARLYRSAEGLIPLVDLAETFSAPPGDGDGAGDGLGDGDDAVTAVTAVTAVIVESQGRRLGLIVDGVGDPIEAVVKPLPPSVRSVRLFSGVTILADGRPTLILELDALAAHVGLRSPAPEPEAELEALVGPERVELLLAHGSGGRRLAVPAASVWRVERAGPERLRQGSGLELLDHGDTLLPLVRLDGETPDADLDVIICVSSGGHVGLVVDRVDDVTEAELVVAPADGRSGLARLCAEGEVAELLDVDAYAPTAALAR